MGGGGGQEGRSGGGVQVGRFGVAGGGGLPLPPLTLPLTISRLTTRTALGPSLA